MKVSAASRVAAVIATVTLAIAYTIVRCADCRRRVLAVPAGPIVEVRKIKKDEPSGRGRTLVCPRCHTALEVIEHGR